MSEKLKQAFTIEQMQPEDLEAATEMRLQSWLDTYVNEEAGVTREWLLARNEQQRSPEKMAARRKRFEESGHTGWIAKDQAGNIVGATNPHIDELGVQHVGSLYVDKAFHGTGVGSALMQKVIEWSDPKKPITLGVVTYNERAKSFYKKWGFVEVPDSETLFAEVVPEIMMIRKGDSQ